MPVCIIPGCANSKINTPPGRSAFAIHEKASKACCRVHVEGIQFWNETASFSESYCSQILYVMRVHITYNPCLYSVALSLQADCASRITCMVWSLGCRRLPYLFIGQNVGEGSKQTSDHIKAIADMEVTQIPLDK